MVMHSARKTLLATVLVPALTFSVLTPAYSAVENHETGGVLNNLFPFGKKHEQVNDSVQVAQVSDSGVLEMQQQLRELTGKVEELNFMVLQMQEQIRDFQNAQPSPNDVSSNGSANVPINNNGTQAFPSVSTTPTHSANNAGQSSSNQNGSVAPRGSNSIKFDQNGNVLNGVASAPQGGNELKSVPQTATSKELYDLGYKNILAGDYRAAEAVFRAFQERYPKDPMISDASFWLGESLYGQNRYREAAQVYIDVQKNYKESPRGPENLLKLGMSMSHLDEKKVACATFAEVTKRYKSADPAVLKRVKDEQSANKCQ